MLQAPSHLSRVCGHGHIKKFWLMQTQKENQACESRSNRSLASPTARPANRGTLKGIDKSPWSTSSPLPHSSALGDAAGTPSKHASFTCAESLSPSSQSCKPSSTLSPSLGSSGAESEKERFNTRLDCLDSFPMAVGGGAHPSMSLPYTRPFNAAAEQPSNVSTVPLADVDSMDPSRVYMNDSSNKERSSSFTEGSPDSNSSQYSRGIQQGLNAHRPLDIGNIQEVKSEDRTSPANHSRELKSFSSHVRFATLMNADDAVSKGKGCGPLGSRMQELDHDFLSHGGYTQHTVPKACSLCGTTKTPMWRSGPHGPKSLCNACGIRFKKYRSFPGTESSGLMASPLLGPAAPKPLLRPLKRKQNSLFSSCDSPSSRKVSLQPAVPDVTSQQQQKKSKWHQMVLETEQRELTYLNQDRSSSWFTRAGPPSLKKIYGCSPFQSKFKKLAPMDDHLSVNGVFAKDEEEAAVLLMHLSCGLVY